MTVAEALMFGTLAHIVADLFFQDHYMASNKARLFYRNEGLWREYSPGTETEGKFVPAIPHFAGWFHAAFHAWFAAYVFSIPVALFLAFIHLLVDTRIPLNIWRNFMNQLNDPEHPVFPVFAFIQDQSIHILCIAAAAWYEFGYLV